MMCLDVLRALRRDPEAANLFGELARQAAPLTGTDATVFEPTNEFEGEAAARITVGKLATLAAAAALEASAPPEVATAFARTRFVQQHAALYGAGGVDARAAETLLRRALPEE